LNQGRGIFAKKSFAEGDVILEEEPFLSVPKNASLLLFKLSRN
jgi:hypothetical protein